MRWACKITQDEVTSKYTQIKLIQPSIFVYVKRPPPLTNDPCIIKEWTTQVIWIGKFAIIQQMKMINGQDCHQNLNSGNLLVKRQNMSFCSKEWALLKWARLRHSNVNFFFKKGKSAMTFNHDSDQIKPLFLCHKHIYNTTF